MPYMTKRTPEQLAQMRVINRRSYLKKQNGVLTRIRPHENTPERKAKKAREKANMRCTRAKQARFTDELTLFISKEAHSLRQLRNKVTGIEWHVDHIVPLKNAQVCGLHIWSNLQVVPKTFNLLKGNTFCPS